jgi:hypothetical protein
MALEGDLLGKIVSEWARTEIQKKDILNYNGAMLAYTDKARVANLLGLSDEQKLGVTPFPSPTTIAIGGNNQEPQSQQKPQAQKAPKTQSDWWKYLLAAVAASGVTVGGMALNKQPQPQAPVPEQSQGNVDLDMEGFPNLENTFIEGKK